MVERQNGTFMNFSLNYMSYMCNFIINKSIKYYG